MATYFPTIGLGYTACYPITRSVTFATRLLAFQNGAEQRWMSRLALVQFKLPYQQLLLADRNAQSAFVDTVKGQFQTTWQLAFGETPTSGGTNFPGLTFTTDSFSWQETSQGLYSGSFDIAQTSIGGLIAGSGGASFPALYAGLVAQFPFNRGKRTLTVAGQLNAGPKYTFGLYGTGLTHFPTRALMWWKWTALLTDAQLATLESFFIAMGGMYGTFSFTDPDGGTSYPYCRFDSDTLTINHIDVNQNHVGVQIAEFTPSSL